MRPTRRAALFFSNLVVSSTESAAAIVVEPVTGLEYPFRYDPKCFSLFKRSGLRHANRELLQFISYRVDCSDVALDLIPDWFRSERARKTVWESRGEFVRLVNQDTLHGKPPAPNDYPAELSPFELLQVLGAISVWGESSFFGSNEEPVPVFTDYETDVLAKAFANGLAEAKLREDLTFAVEGVNKAFFFAKERVTIGGRVFYKKDKKLHLIFGDLHQPARYPGKKDVRGADQEVDRRLYPIKTGGRESGEAHEWRIVSVKGQLFYNSGGEMRADWLVIDLPTMLAALHEKATDLPAPVAKEAERARAEARRLGVGRRQMREEMARMREEMRKLGASKGVSSVSATLARRLATLGWLKKKNLISREEYDSKRQEA